VASPPPLNPPHKSFYLTKPSYHRSTFAELDGHNCNTTNRVLRLWFEARLLGIVQLAGQQHRLIEVI